MKWLRLKRTLLALACCGCLFDWGCPTDTALQTAASNAGQTFGNTIISSVVKTFFNDVFGTKI